MGADSGPSPGCSWGELGTFGGYIVVHGDIIWVQWGAVWGSMTVHVDVMWGAIGALILAHREQ